MVLAAVILGSQLPSSLEVARLTPDVVLIAALWVIGLVLVQRAGHGLPWHESGTAPEATPHRQGHRRHQRPKETDRAEGSASTGKVATIFGVSALGTLVAGVVLERSGDAASGHIGLSGVLFGATFLALATSLPEISTGLQAIRQSDDNLAMSDIFGGNAFLPVLFLVATLISGKAILSEANASDVYLTALAALLTLVYGVGLIFRPQPRVAGMASIPQQ